jgi:hypothetical protein
MGSKRLTFRRGFTLLAVCGLGATLAAGCSTDPAGTAIENDLDASVDATSRQDGSSQIDASGSRDAARTDAQTSADGARDAADGGLTDAATEAASPCGPGTQLCGATCVDVNLDPAHCGSCDNACSRSQVCSNGTCGVRCLGGTTLCGDRCVDTSSDRNYCGGCDSDSGATVCSDGQVCSNGTCQTTCGSGQVECGGRCIDPTTDRAFCGASLGCGVEAGSAGTVCARGQICSNGVCETSCGTGLVNCGGTCVNPRNDGTYCGATGDCAGANAGTTCSAGQLCNNGTCQFSCPQGQVVCNGTCVNPQTDRTYCGASDSCTGANAGTTCSAGQVCSNGTCQISCPQGQVACNGTCINPQTDLTFCGASGACTGGSAGTTCASGQVCSNGTCQLSCAQGQIACNGSCINPQTDRTYCGASGACTGGTVGAVCATGQVCSNGACQVSCPVGQIECNGTCVNPQSDRTYCGASGACTGGDVGTACSAGQVCSNGSCTASCGGATPNVCGTAPNTSCVNFTNDANNCNGCGNVCAAGASCTNGACACPSGTVSCGTGNTARCVDASLCSSGNFLRDCQAIKDASPFLGSGVYTIDPDGSGTGAPFQVYCDMVSDGGGWTLVLKGDGNDARFEYNQTTWTTTTTTNANYTFNTGSTDLTAQSAKFESFNTVRTGDVRAVMVTGGTTVRSLRLDIPVQSMPFPEFGSIRALFAGSKINVASPTRADWLNMIGGGGSLQPNCNDRGFNITGSPFAYSRIGIIGNEQNDCGSSDSYLGFGNGGQPCGQTNRFIGMAGACGTIPVNGVSTAAFGYIFVRPNVRTDFTGLSTQASCAAHLAQGRNRSGLYTIDPDGNGGVAAFPVSCDMTTDGGGWTIFASFTGADGETPMVGDADVNGNPLAFEHSNTTRAKKMALNAISTQSLFRRPNGAFVRLATTPFDSNLATPNAERAVATTMTVSSGQVVSAYVGYSTFNIAGGGDFGISLSPDAATCAGTTVNGFDRHSSTYRQLNCGCQRQYLYSYSLTNADGDPGYDVNTGLGAWTVTTGCDGNEGGLLVFYAAMR